MYLAVHLLSEGAAQRMFDLDQTLRLERPLRRRRDLDTRDGRYPRPVRTLLGSRVSGTATRRRPRHGRTSEARRRRRRSCGRSCSCRWSWRRCWPWASFPATGSWCGWFSSSPARPARSSETPAHAARRAPHRQPRRPLDAAPPASASPRPSPPCPGACVHASSANGKLVVTLEAPTAEAMTADGGEHPAPRRRAVGGARLPVRGQPRRDERGDFRCVGASSSGSPPRRPPAPRRASPCRRRRQPPAATRASSGARRPAASAAPAAA